MIAILFPHKAQLFIQQLIRGTFSISLNVFRKKILHSKNINFLKATFMHFFSDFGSLYLALNFKTPNKVFALKLVKSYENLL